VITNHEHIFFYSAIAYLHISISNIKHTITITLTTILIIW